MTATPAANDNDATPEAVPIMGTGLAGRREWVASIIPHPAPRGPRNKGRHEDLARPALMWWRSTLTRSGDASSWPDLSADNDNVDSRKRGLERPWAVRDLNPMPRHTAEALVVSSRRGARVSVTTTRSPAGEWGLPKRRRHLVKVMRNGQTARLGGLEFNTEPGRGVQFVRVGGAVAVRHPHISQGRMVRVNGYPIKDEVGRPRESRAADEVAAEQASADHFTATLGGGALPHQPAPRRLFMGMSVAARAGQDHAVRGEVEHVDTVEGAIIAHQDMALFRAAYPFESAVLDRTMTARRFGDLAANDNAATGRRLLKRAVDTLEKFLAS